MVCVCACVRALSFVGQLWHYLESKSELMFLKLGQIV